MKYPVDCITPGQRMEYLCIAKKQLIAKLNADLRLSDASQKQSLKEEYNSRIQHIFNEMGEQKQSMEKSTKWIVKLEDIEKVEM